jgi:hypothetical protein
VAKLNNDFYSSCEALKNAAGFARFMESLEAYYQDVLSGLALASDLDDVRRLQGEARLLQTILKAASQSAEVRRRLEAVAEHSKKTGDAGPSISAIT